MSDYKGHARFAAFWDRATRNEVAIGRQLRREAAGKLSGRVLELGAGVGANWPYLPAGIDYVGIEPDPYMLVRARRHADSRGEHLPLEQARAELLPFEDERFDTVLVTWTLCSVDDPRRALSEASRVLKPGGTLVFAEHVRPNSRLVGMLFDLVTPLWRRVGGGCHPNRVTGAAIASSGLEIQELTRHRMHGLPTIAGTARKPVPSMPSAQP